VSVILASYNHGRYVEDAVQSVLDQTSDDLEIIVVDDGSSDDTAERVASFTDERLQLYRLYPNRGACAAMNLALQQTSSDLVAVINSDDVWEPSKLQRQLEVFNEAPELAAVFTGARLVSETGKPLTIRELPKWHAAFRQPNRSQARWLRRFFEHGNCLCHPSALVRRTVFDEIGYYDNRLRQLPDLDRWIELAKRAPFAVLGDEELVRFRVQLRHGNTSSGSPANVARTLHEHLVLCESFFKGCSPELFADGFGDLFLDPMASTPEELACERLMLWLNGPSTLQTIYRFYGITELYRLLARPKERALLLGRYGVDDSYVHDLAGELADETVRDAIDPGDWLAPAFGPRDVLPPPSTGEILRELRSRLRTVPVWKWPHRAAYHLKHPHR
jgi:hypothetical protein